MAHMVLRSVGAKTNAKQKSLDDVINLREPANRRETLRDASVATTCCRQRLAVLVRISFRNAL